MEKEKKQPKNEVSKPKKQSKKQVEETPKKDVKAPIFEQTWKDQEKFQTD